jgi:hypothetical protein
VNETILNDVILKAELSYVLCSAIVNCFSVAQGVVNACLGSSFEQFQ